MTQKISTTSVQDEMVMNKIYLIRGYKVMLDSDLAMLYQVETKVLKQAVRRNKIIFPSHFMFELTTGEFENLRSQIVTSSWGGKRYLPYVFTEHGVLQLANVLRSRRARMMGIRIIEVFVKLRKMLTEHTEIWLAIEKLERKTEKNTKNIEMVFRYFEQLVQKKGEKVPRKKIGYKIPVKRKRIVKKQSI